MRASGASFADSNMVVLVLVVALAIVVFLMGGPRPFLDALESGLRVILDTVYTWVKVVL